MREHTYYHNGKRMDWPWRVVGFCVAGSLTIEITGLKSMSIQASSRNWRGSEVRVGSPLGKKKLKITRQSTNGRRIGNGHFASKSRQGGVLRCPDNGNRSHAVMTSGRGATTCLQVAKQLSSRIAANGKRRCGSIAAEAKVLAILVVGSDHYWRNPPWLDPLARRKSAATASGSDLGVS